MFFLARPRCDTAFVWVGGSVSDGDGSCGGDSVDAAVRRVSEAAVACGIVAAPPLCNVLVERDEEESEEFWEMFEDGY